MARIKQMSFVDCFITSEFVERVFKQNYKNRIKLLKKITREKYLLCYNFEQKKNIIQEYKKQHIELRNFHFRNRKWW